MYQIFKLAGRRIFDRLDRDSRSWHKAPMSAPAPTPEHPDAALIASEAELEALVIEWNALDDA
jgi:hypothetical protein